MKKLKLKSRFQSQKPIVWVVAFAIIGVVTLAISRAATVFVSVEPESGTASSEVSIFTDPTASNGQFVAFGSNNSSSGLPGTDTTCVFKSVTSPSVAFCDGFNKDWGLDKSGARNGPLSEVWGASRIRGGGDNNPWAQSIVQGCGSTAFVNPPNDLRICNNRLYETINDDHDQDTLGLYPKQPFDFAGRTGTVVFDMSTDTHGTHGAWPEFLVTDQPIPAPKADVVSGQAPTMRNGIGVIFGLDKCHGDDTLMSVSTISVVRNYVADMHNFDNWSVDECLKKTNAGDANINHFEIKVAQNKIEVWGAEAGSSTIKLLAHLDNANLSITKGLVWMNDVRYNAAKDGYPVNQNIHTFAWDNLGFDGPKTYRDLSFDVPDNTEQLLSAFEGTPSIGLGYVLVAGSNVIKQTAAVYRSQTPTSVLVTFNWYDRGAFAPSFRLNNGPWHDNAYPWTDGIGSGWRALGVNVPVAEVIDGVNTIEFKVATNGWANTAVSNINVILVAGAPVP